MASKFADFIAQHKLDRRRILAASRKLEKLRPADRALKRQKRASDSPPKQGEAQQGDAEQPAPTKPRSGRPVTVPLLDAATEGRKVPGPAKTKLLRAVNHLLQQKKKDAADLNALF